MTRHLLFLLSILTLLLGTSTLHAAKPPAWIRAAMECTCDDKEADAAILHDEVANEIKSNGRIDSTHRRVIRILKDKGSSYSKIALHYNTDYSEIDSLRIWLVYPNGEMKTYSKKQAADIALDAAALYSESRSLVFIPPDPVYENCVFAYEYTEENRDNDGQPFYFLQREIPVLFTRYSYELPKNWTLDSTTFNHAPIQPTLNKNTYTWEISNLPACKREPYAPSYHKLLATIAINLHPPAGQKFKNPRLTYTSWSDLAAYYISLYEKNSAPDSAITEKTRQLAGTSTNLLDRIRPLARHAQNINYINISIGLGSGGGRIPRPAPVVLKTGYGDCKDKTTLLRSMLSVLNIESFPVLAYSGDRNYVTPSWPANQFNHVITAIRVDDSVNAPAVINHPTLGRLLLFDPTDPYTPFGELADNLQGSHVLPIAANSALFQLPFTLSQTSHITRNITGTITAAGTIVATVNETSVGEPAIMERVRFKKGLVSYTDFTRNWILNSIKAAKLTNLVPSDNFDANTFDLSFQVAAPAYAQSMRGKLLVFKPALVSRRNQIPLTKPERTQPVLFETSSFSENTTITIPETYTPAELPSPVEITTDFGSYASTCNSTGSSIQYNRTFLLKNIEIPVADYPKVRHFFESIRKAEQTPVVLELK